MSKTITASTGRTGSSPVPGIMRYVLIIRTDESAAVSAQERSWREQQAAAFQAEQRLRGMSAGGELLQPAQTATWVRCWPGGDVEVGHGPPAGGNEQMSGFFVIDCAGRCEAIRAATEVPAAWYGTIEIRPVAQ
jgi:hypothetical protein